MTHDTEHMSPPPAPPVSPRPPLRRSDSDRVVAGVAGGLARWLDIDPVIIRVLFVVLAVFGGSGLILYVIGWLFIPSESASASEAERFIERSKARSTFTRVLLITALVVVALVLVANLNGPFGHWGGGGAILLLVAIGAVAIYLTGRKSPSTPGQQQPAAMDAGPSPSSVEPSVTGAVSEPNAYLPPPDPATAYAYGGSGSYPGYQTPVAVQPVPRPPRERSYLGLATLSLAIIVGGILATLSWAGSAHIPLVVIFASMVAILGAGMIVGGFAGRAKWLTFLAVPLLIMTMIASVLPSDLGNKLGHGAGQRYWTPTTLSDLATPYQLSVGDAQLDLTQLVVPPGSGPVAVDATVNFGTLKVVVPHDARVYVKAKVGIGQIGIETGFSSVPIGNPNGVQPYSVSGRNVVYNGPLADNPKTGPQLNLYLTSSIGAVEVDRA